MKKIILLAIIILFAMTSVCLAEQLDRRPLSDRLNAIMQGKQTIAIVPYVKRNNQYKFSPNELYTVFAPLFTDIYVVQNYDDTKIMIPDLSKAESLDGIKEIIRSRDLDFIIFMRDVGPGETKGGIYSNIYKCTTYDKTGQVISDIQIPYSWKASNRKEVFFETIGIVQKAIKEKSGLL